MAANQDTEAAHQRQHRKPAAIRAVELARGTGDERKCERHVQPVVRRAASCNAKGGEKIDAIAAALT